MRKSCVCSWSNASSSFAPLRLTRYRVALMLVQSVGVLLSSSLAVFVLAAACSPPLLRVPSRFFVRLTIPLRIGADTKAPRRVPLRSLHPSAPLSPGCLMSHRRLRRTGRAVTSSCGEDARNALSLNTIRSSTVLPRFRIEFAFKSS
mmetsp:Transcript_11856/g.27349  ORF Transcript_11856/g.27349 Transcript_11856/m.27349 type:complete len:147 (-) Transcript_11856:2-442(-)|eukprot:21744-Hanusia_phi.AAC.4